MTTVPYKGTAPAMTDLLGGQVDIMCDQTTNTTGQIEAGKVKAFAVTSPKRLTTPALAKLPTLDEVGPEGLQRHHLARPVCAQGHAEGGAGPDQRRAAHGAEGPRVHQARRGLGAVVVTDGRLAPAEHKKFVEAEINKLGVAIKAAGQYAD